MSKSGRWKIYRLRPACAFGFILMLVPYVASTSGHSCSVAPFSQKVKAGETASFSVRLIPSLAGKEFTLELGDVPLQVEGGFENPDASAIAAAALVLRTGKNTPIASYSLVVNYAETGSDAAAVCRLNLIVEPGQSSPANSSPPPAASAAIPRAEPSILSKSFSAVATSSMLAPASVRIPEAISAHFASDLALGSGGEEVTRLQKILSPDSAIYPEGLVTGFYGIFTAAAVKRYQERVGLFSTGRLDELTRRKLESSFAGKISPPLLTATLRRGDSGEAVRILQDILRREGFFPAAQESIGYFGVLTRVAVKAFQQSRGLEAVGQVGPLTRRALNALGTRYWSWPLAQTEENRNTWPKTSKERFAICLYEISMPDY